MRIKKILGICTAVVMLFSASVSVCAVDVSSNVPEEIKEFADIVGLNGLQSPRPIYSPDEELFGYCAEGTNCYIIYDTEYNMVEYSNKGESRYADVYSKLYYGGPLNYYIKDNGDYYDLCSGELLSINDFYTSESFEQILSQNEFMNNELIVSPLSLTTSMKKIDGEVSYYQASWNTDNGSCGQLAATAALAYLQAVFGIGLPTFYLSNPYYLYLSLLDIIPHSTKNYGTTPSQMVTGLSSFATKNRYTYKVHYNPLSTASYNNYKTYINNDIPSLIDTTNHPKYDEHWAIGIGYRTVNYNGNITYQCVVDDGWGNPEVYINNTYVEGILFITPQ